jgi:hypothetical protein
MAGPRILLFGSPGVGKTSLHEAAEKVSGPFSNGVTVLDGSGASALEMLQANEPFTAAQPLRQDVLNADAVVLVADVSLTSTQLTDQFRQFAHWLKALHEFRGRRTDIAELPVYFVLSKCDLLAKKDDTNGAWIKHIEEIKGKFDENFRKYLKMDSVGFGTLKLKLSATAIKRPALADRPAMAQEPFGVAELFRECVQSANDFHERRQTAQSRLQNVVVGLVGLIVMLVLSVAFLVEFQPPPRGTSLDEKVQAALPKSNADATERLRGTSKKLQDRATKLAEIESDAEFARLPSATRKAVSDNRAELTAYLLLEQETQTKLKLPYLAKNDDELKKQESEVEKVASPKAWADTRVGKSVERVKREYQMLHAAIDAEDAWVQGQIAENRKLEKAGNRVHGKLLDQDAGAEQEAKDWQRHYRAQMNHRPPMPRDDNVPGVSQIAYEDLAKFAPLKASYKEWRKSKDDLSNIADLIQKKLVN